MSTVWGNWATTPKTMDQAWGGSFTVQYLDHAAGFAPHPVQSVSLSGMGVIAGFALVDYGGDGASPTDYGTGITELDAEWDAYMVWRAAQGAPPIGTWWLFRAYVTAPGPVIQSHYYVLGHHVLAEWYGPTSLTFTFSSAMENVVLKARGGDSHPTGRNLRDFIDQHLEYGWFATAATSSSVTMACPASPLGAKSDLTASGAWASGPAVGEFDPAWPTTFELDYSIAYNANTAIDTEYATISPTWAGQALDLQYLDDRYYDAAWHTWWNGSAFQSPWPPAGKTAVWRVYGTGGTTIAARRVGGASSDTMNWTGYSRVPYIVTFKVDCGRWSTDYGDFPSPMLIDAANLHDDAGDRIYLSAADNPSPTYTEAQHSWYTEDRFDKVIQGDVLWLWAMANGEYVSEGGLDDLPCEIGAHWLMSDFTEDPWGGYFDVVQTAVNVHKPAGVARPTLWTGGGGLSIVSQTDTTVTFTVAAGAPSPTLTRTFTSRYWAQMDRLLPPHYDSTWSFKPDWPIYLKANLDTSIGGAIPLTDPDYATLTADEDITNWDNFSYLALPFTAGAAGGNLTVALGYVELLNVTDPCYTNWADRFGPDGEWTYSKGGVQTATYAVDYLGAAISGTGTHYVDLRCPAEGDLSRGALQHVASITVTGFGVPGAGTETWTLDGANLKLCDGPVAAPNHLAFNAKRAWDWDRDFFGVSAHHDGAPILAIQYGYEQFERAERGLKYQQYVQHAPGSSATTDPTTAKTLVRLGDELSRQEGFVAGIDTTVFAERFQDLDGNWLFTPAQAYWWWIEQYPDDTRVPPFGIGATVRTYTIAPGVDHWIWISHYLQGNVHGLLKDATGTYRTRSSAAIVNLYKHPLAGGADVLVSTVASDAHGRFVSGPVAEEGYSYYLTVTGRAGSTPLGNAVNREWLSSNVAWSEVEVACCDGGHGLVHLVYTQNGSVWHKSWHMDGTVSAPHFVGAGKRATIEMRPDGGLCVTYQSATGDTWASALSKNAGRTWAAVI